MQQQYQQRMKQQQALMQQSILQQQAALYHPGVLAAPPQIEPILSGNLPPGFDSSACRSVYVGNIHPQVTDPLLQEVFSSTGVIEGCKLIRKEKSSYGFVDYYDRRSASLAIVTLNGRHLFGQPIKVNWAYASSQREDTTNHHNVFVGDLSPEVTDATLFACFSAYHSCSDARVMWDQKTGRSRGFGFVSFRNQQDAQGAINDLNGKWLGSRQIRCNWATKGSAGNDDKSSADAMSAAEFTNESSEEGQERTNDEAPENNSQYTTVYVGNLASEVTSVDLHRHFHFLGAGVIEDVRVQRDKGFGFVRYSTHAEAARAIQLGNARVLCGKPIKLHQVFRLLATVHKTLKHDAIPPKLRSSSSSSSVSALDVIGSSFSNFNLLFGQCCTAPFACALAVVSVQQLLCPFLWQKFHDYWTLGCTELGTGSETNTGTGNCKQKI